MHAIVFLGPTLSVESARRHLDASYWGPAAQGDVLRALRHRPRLIGIVDGYFETVPAVWHKEILYAMSQGVHVFGAASMGALRAAELEPFGMIGVGTVFEWYRSGEIEDDDEVAIEHGPSEYGYVPLSEAMVNLRHAVSVARGRGLMSDTLASRFLATAKGLHYTQRDHRRVLQILRNEIDPAQATQLDRFFGRSKDRVKEADAVLLLRTAASFLASDPPPKRVSYSVERTVFLDAMIAEAERTAAQQDAAADADGHLASSPDATMVRHEVLMRLLARREATRLGFDCSHDELREARQAFAAARSLSSEEAMRAALQRCGLNEPTFAAMLRDAVLLEKLDRYYDRDLCAGLPAHLRIRALGRPAAL